MAGIRRELDDGAGCSQPCSSGFSRKRKKLDSNDDILSREGPLTEAPIDNEYEHLDDDDDDDCRGLLKESDQREIMEGQAKATISQYGNIKITPFNLEEELKEGEFDKAGNFIFKKMDDEDTDEEESDTWAESVDWAEIEKKEKQQREQQQRDLDAKMSIEPTERPVIGLDRISVYKSMLRIMKPDEIVKKTIQRLGNSVPKRKPFNKNAKSKLSRDISQNSQASEADEARRKLDLMIELAHGRLADGDLDIYQKSYEDLEDAIN